MKTDLELPGVDPITREMGRDSSAFSRAAIVQEV